MAGEWGLGRWSVLLKVPLSAEQPVPICSYGGKKGKNKCDWVGPPVFCAHGAGWGPLDAKPPSSLMQDVFLSYQVSLQ